MKQPLKKLTLKKECIAILDNGKQLNIKNVKAACAAGNNQLQMNTDFFSILVPICVEEEA